MIAVTWGDFELVEANVTTIRRTNFYFLACDVILASVLELGEVGVEVEVPLLRLREHLLQHEDVGVRRVDELALDLGGDDVADVGQHVPHFVVRVGVFHQPIVGFTKGT